MEPARVAIIYRPGGAATLQEICRASAGICEPVILLEAAHADADPLLLEAARGATKTRVLESCSDTDEVARACRVARVRGLTTFHDLDLDVCDAVTARLALPGAPGTEAPWDKLRQRERIPADVSVPAAAVDSASDLRRAVGAIGFPAVLKPRRATGGTGVAFIREPDDVAYQENSRGHWDGLLLESCVTLAPHPSGVGHLAGYVSVESVCTGDARHHVALFDKMPVVVGHRDGPDGSDRVSVTGTFFPSRLDSTARQTVIDAVDRSLASLGVSWRVTHTEVALTAHGPVIVEVNGRVGGHLNRLLLMTGGVDLVRSALECALGRTPRLGDRHPSGWALGYYPPFPQPAGAVRSEVTVRDIRGLPGVRGVSDLARYGAARSVSHGRMLNLTAGADDAETLDAHFAGIRKGIEYLFRNDHGAM
ncbi:hypothetical protein KDL01_16555 [Actinospica durhamensis]|uniref:ATP-grasp domain-containing protein n=1 Tax=Actinospica durhamensis TaxID=1508375 RepID=A0A941EPA4_9ACTN|nr:hypothetical protein [Actinospica durhamensis]MBR7834886.1 hypothetical protein [Actinospica durhamensis]